LVPILHPPALLRSGKAVLTACQVSFDGVRNRVEVGVLLPDQRLLPYASSRSHRSSSLIEDLSIPMCCIHHSINSGEVYTAVLISHHKPQITALPCLPPPPSSFLPSLSVGIIPAQADEAKCHKPSGTSRLTDILPEIRRHQHFDAKVTVDPPNELDGVIDLEV